MKTKISQRAIILSIVLILLLGCLSGCGASKSPGEFRGIPFGTKFNEAKDLMAADLKEQGYNADPEEFYARRDSYYSLSYSGVNLYDYKTTVNLLFYDETKNGDKDNSIFYFGNYYISFEDLEECETCYKFFYDKLKEKYGNGKPYEEYKESITANCEGTQFINNGTDIKLYQQLIYYNGAPINVCCVKIEYTSTKIQQQC